MSIVVQKFGGTSLADPDHIERVADRIVASSQEHQSVVVVSAMAGETNRLWALAQSLQQETNHRECAALLSTGEQVTMTLLTMALGSRGVSARSLNAYQAGIITNDEHLDAKITDIKPDHMLDLLKQHDVLVVAGFQGMTATGDITTLGRGGSDYTAVALAIALDAKVCHIYTDVDGVYTADPRVVETARLIEQMDFIDMVEVSSLGAKVLQPQAADLAARYQMPLRVMSTFKQHGGTEVGAKVHLGTAGLSDHIMAIPHRRGIVKLSLQFDQGQHLLLNHWLDKLSEDKIVMEMVHCEEGCGRYLNCSMVINRRDYRCVMAILAQPEWQSRVVRVQIKTNLAVLSVVGSGLKHVSYTEVTRKVMRALREAHLPTFMFSTTETQVSVVLNEKDIKQAVSLLHRVLDLSSADVASHA